MNEDEISHVNANKFPIQKLNEFTIEICSLIVRPQVNGFFPGGFLLTKSTKFSHFALSVSIYEGVLKRGCR